MTVWATVEPFWPIGHIDAFHAEAALIDDGVDGDRGLPGLPVADEQLPLTPPDGRHGVDGFDAGLQRLLDGLTIDDPGGLHLEAAAEIGDDRPLTVDGLAQGVDHPPEQGVAYRHGQDLAGGLHRLTLLEAVDFSEHDRADGVLVEVERQPGDPSLELEQLVDGRVRQPGDPDDPVVYLQHPSDLLGGHAGREPGHVAFEGRGDVLGVDCQLGHQLGPPVVISASGEFEALLEKFEAMAGAAVHHGVAHGRHEPAQHGRIDSDQYVHGTAGHPAQGLSQLAAPVVVEVDRDPYFRQPPVALSRHPIDEMGQQRLVVTGAAYLGGVGGQAQRRGGGPGLQEIDDQGPAGGSRNVRAGHGRHQLGGASDDAQEPEELVFDAQEVVPVADLLQYPGGVPVEPFLRGPVPEHHVAYRL